MWATARSVSKAALAMVTVLGAGCREGWQPDYRELGLVEVTGRITMDGRPLSAVTVLFECPDRSFSSGETDKDGIYRLMFDSETRGVLPGPKVVRIRAGRVGDEATAGDADLGGHRPLVAIPSCYGSRSKLLVTVDGNSRTMDFELKSDCSVTGPVQ